MSAWHDTAGAVLIAAAAFMMWRDSRILAFPPYRRRDAGQAERKARQKALSRLLYGLFYLAFGVYLLAGLSTQVIAVVLVCGLMVASAAYDVTVWRRSRRRRAT
jgi:uncharacterized membrane protein YdcZ (DUF606 family)